VQTNRLSILENESLTIETKMNTLQGRADWNIPKGTLKQKWAELTEDDLYFADGKMDELVGRIQKRTRATLESIESMIQGFPSVVARLSTPRQAVRE